MVIHPKVTEIVSLFPHGRIVLYLVRGERNALVDTGMMITPEQDIAPVLESLGLTLADIHLILNTHGHFDHTGGDYAVKSAGNARILIHTEEASMVSNRKRYLDDFFAPMVKGVLGEEHLEMDWGNFVQLAGPETSVDGFLEDNEVIDLGAGCELRVLHLPGHTAGSLGFYWEKEGILFSGDSLSGLHDAAGGLPILMDLEAYKNAVKRVGELPIRYLLMSHDYRGISLPPANIRRHEEVKRHIEDCSDVADRLSEAIRAIPVVNMDEPVIKVYDEVVARLPQKMGFKKLDGLSVPALSAEVILFTRRRMNELKS
jgi:hydroxyacylglutathione hydrolase